MQIKCQIAVQGCWRDANRMGVPPLTGVYFVYVGTLIPNENFVRLGRLLHIGQSLNANSSLLNHGSRSEWFAQLVESEELCYAFASVERLVLDDVAEALACVLHPDLDAGRSVDGYSKRPIEIEVSAPQAYRIPPVISLP